ncbi:kinase-like domain-containing protein [Rhizophagus irregularis DAOM 181602=DAOM 197198]|nr:kinase-like domain-containing protein [Rhizophagus irregularis DAOM 181602=DAOM 197198]
MDPTPRLKRLKSSPIIIYFLPFNNNENHCNYCKTNYSKTILFKQKYCEKCFFKYIKEITKYDKPMINIINEYLNVYNVYTNANCENIRSDNIQEWFNEFSYFEQVVTNYSFHPIDIKEQNNYNIIIENESYCKLCKKSIIYRQNDQINFKLCKNCYIITTDLIESSLTKKPIQIIYLLWWDANSQCMICKLDLMFISDCQKICSFCYLIYIGCRYCLTTNIIFGITNKSQCKICERTSEISINIDFDNINSENIDIEKFLISTRSNNKNNTEGGFGIVYKATLLDGSKYKHDDFLSIRNKNKLVAIKKFLNIQDISNDFLNELNSLHQCYNNRIIKYYGITKDPKTKEYMIIMNYASGGDLHNYLRKNFNDITWDKKLYILWQITEGLKSIHENDFIHRDFHSGNILCEIETIGKWQIGDLGLSQPAKNTSINNEIYGVIPYIAPEIFRGFAFSKESDIYSMECYANLMERCWDPDPSKRLSIKEICETIYSWSFNSFKDDVISGQFKQAEKTREELIKSKKISPEFNESLHAKAIYTSRPLRSFISKSSFINSLSKSDKLQPSIGSNKEYVTKEYLLDINHIQSKTSSSLNSSRKRNIEELTSEVQCNVKQVKMDNNLNSESIN